MTIKPGTLDQSVALIEATVNLHRARDLLRKADCPKVLAKVRLALKSAEGAQRHMQHRRSAPPC